MLITDNAAMIALADALTVPDGGFTVNLITGDRPGWGWVVSLADRELILDTASAADLAAYANDHADVLGNYWAMFGGWRNPRTNKIHLDVSVRVASRALAERLARQHHQLAIFNIDLGRSFRIAPTLL